MILFENDIILLIYREPHTHTHTHTHTQTVSTNEFSKVLRYKINTQGLPWWLSGRESACQSRRYRFP